jgi:hypothetical protein
MPIDDNYQGGMWVGPPIPFNPAKQYSGRVYQPSNIAGGKLTKLQEAGIVFLAQFQTIVDPHTLP